MQSNGSSLSASDPKTTDISPVKEKKIPPPKPAKRVSFDLNYHQIVQKSSSVVSSSFSKHTVNGPSQQTSELSYLNGGITVKTTEHQLPTVETQTNVGKLRKNSLETKGDRDKECDKPPSPAKVNTNTYDTGQSNADKGICNIPTGNSSPTKTETKPTTTERLRLEFIKINDRSEITVSSTLNSSWSNRKTENQPSLEPSLKSPNLQTRLSESQSKIAKLQQSLPTKLSDATVESLKSKYSPASFGYPRSFIKSPSEVSRIPSFGSKVPTLSPSKTTRLNDPSSPDSKNKEPVKEKNTANTPSVSRVPNLSTVKGIKVNDPTSVENKNRESVKENTSASPISEVSLLSPKVRDTISAGRESCDPVKDKGTTNTFLSSTLPTLSHSKIPERSNLISNEYKNSELVRKEGVRNISTEKNVSSVKVLEANNSRSGESKSNESSSKGDICTPTESVHKIPVKEKNVTCESINKSRVDKEAKIITNDEPEVTDYKDSNVHEERNISIGPKDEILSTSTSKATVKRKLTFRTELYIPPSGPNVIKDKLKDSNPCDRTAKKSIEDVKSDKQPVIIEDNLVEENKVTGPIDKVEDVELKAPTVQAKFISSEIFPKEKSVSPEPAKAVPLDSYIIPEQKTVDSNPSEDISEHSSDTLTESEDSQNTRYRNLPSESDSTATTKEDADTCSFTSDITYCEVYEEEEETREVEMDEAKKKPQKKRSNSFKRIFGFGSSKDKKKNDESKSSKNSSSNGLKKKDNMLSENAQNEAHVFDRNSSQRHTFSGHYTPKDWSNQRPQESVPGEPFYSNPTEQLPTQCPQDQYLYENNRVTMPVTASRPPCPPKDKTANKTEDGFSQLMYDLYLAQPNVVGTPQPRSLDEYVCMDNDKFTRSDLTQPGFINAHSIDKYIDTTSSSSISTLESDTRNIIYENTAKGSRVLKIQNNTKIPISSFSPDRNLSKDSSPSIGEKCYERPKFSDSPEIFTTTPRRAQGPQLIKPKAIIPINTERPLPNPYRNSRENQPPRTPENRENIYGNFPAPEKSGDATLNNIEKQFPAKNSEYGKPVPAVRRNILVQESTYTNISRDDSNRNAQEDIYGTVYDSLIPVGAQLKITKPPIIGGGRNKEKRSRSASPSQRHKAVNLSSTQSFNYKSKSPPAQNSSPNRKELEATKLKLPSNREKVEIRLKSPVEDRRNFPTKKLPDVSKKENKNNVPSHQNLEIEIDYPDNNINEAQDRKETPEKVMFSSKETDEKRPELLSPKRITNLKRSPHVSPNRPKSFTHFTPKNQGNPSLDTSYSDVSRLAALRSPVLSRTESPISITSSHSVSSFSSRSKLPVASEDLRDLKNTEVYFWEQTTQDGKPVKKEDISPDQSPQQVLTQATVHQPKASPKNVEVSGFPPDQVRSVEQKRPVDPAKSVDVAGHIKPLGSTGGSVDQVKQQQKPAAPQKMQNLQNVEAFYWQQIKKLKEKEEHEIYNQHLQMLARQNVMNYSQEYSAPGRSRSRSLGPVPGQKRSMSLPRDANPPSNSRGGNNDPYGYTRQGRQNSIPEGRPVVAGQQRAPEYGVVRSNLPNSNFIRGSPQRNTVGAISVQKNQASNDKIYENYFPGVEIRHQAKSVPGSGHTPIFKRGSLIAGQTQESPPQGSKKVSFSSAQDDAQVWPTKNGFTQSPPTRRVDKRPGSGDDEVFLPSNSLDNLKNAQLQQQLTYAPGKDIYGTNVPKEMYGVKPTKEPVYGRTGKHVTVTNKVCDIYGQIHDVPTSPQGVYGNIQKTGVIYGQLQANPVPGSPMSLRGQQLNRSDPSFVRGTRLTASFNDMRTDGPRRPLPPVPGVDLQKVYGRIGIPVTESESGSEAGEVQRILGQKERRRIAEEEWNSDGKSGRNQSGADSGIVKEPIIEIVPVNEEFLFSSPEQEPHVLIAEAKSEEAQPQVVVQHLPIAEAPVDTKIEVIPEVVAEKHVEEYPQIVIIPVDKPTDTTEPGFQETDLEVPGYPVVEIIKAETKPSESISVVEERAKSVPASSVVEVEKPKWRQPCIPRQIPVPIPIPQLIHPMRAHSALQFMDSRDLCSHVTPCEMHKVQKLFHKTLNQPCVSLEDQEMKNFLLTCLASKMRNAKEYHWAFHNNNYLPDKTTPHFTDHRMYHLLENMLY